jgi:hypothetical protein
MALIRPIFRGPRPPIIPGQPIDFYSHYDLQQLVRWVLSDGRLRTHDEILSELVIALGSSRRGTRITSAIQQAIRSVRPLRPV